MARDYKHRAQHASYGARRRKAPSVWWRWALAAALIIAFVVFLNMVRSSVTEIATNKSETSSEQTQQVVTQELAVQTQTPVAEQSAKEETPAAEQEAPQPEEPRYDFYTILPEAEIVIPDYEIQSRVREEFVGKSKAVKYIMQAGSFREASDAERHKAKLASLGIESWIEKAKIGDVIWHRVKIGPYDNPSSVSTIKELLQKNGIGVIVTEQEKSG